MTNQPPNRTQASLDAPHPAEPVWTYTCDGCGEDRREFPIGGW